MNSKLKDVTEASKHTIVPPTAEQIVRLLVSRGYIMKACKAYVALKFLPKMSCEVPRCDSRDFDSIDAINAMIERQLGSNRKLRGGGRRMLFYCLLCLFLPLLVVSIYAHYWHDWHPKLTLQVSASIALE